MSLLQRLYWGRLPALLKQLPVGLQLSHVKLGPSLNEALLPLRKEADDKGDR
jgi:hypothetical protein